MLNHLPSPDFYLGMRLEGAPETQPAGARLRTELGRWLATLDRQAIQQSYLEERYEDVPTYEWEHDGWRIIFEPMPKADAAREDTSVRPLAMAMPMQARRLRLDEALKDAVAKKDRYGRLPLPLVVAVQVIDEFRIDTIAVMDGLFGPEAIGFDAQGQERPGPGSGRSVGFALRSTPQKHQRRDGMVYARPVDLHKCRADQSLESERSHDRMHLFEPPTTPAGQRPKRYGEPIYAPWLAFPLPKEILGVAVPPPPPAPKPAKLQRGGPPTYGFYYDAPGGVMVEVSTMNIGEPV